jgi:L-amino acid N-acyltransferase YncA
MQVRLAAAADAERLSSIYRQYVTGTAVSFELDPPDAVEMARRIESTLPTHPFIVAEQERTVVGYAYGGRHRLRAAYRWSADVSIYVADDQQRNGIGRTLYSTLIALMRAQGYRQAFAGITLPNQVSVGFHEALGFRPVGVYRQVGWKLGKWHDVGWWQLDIDASPTAPGEMRNLDELDVSVVEDALRQ